MMVALAMALILAAAQAGAAPPDAAAMRAAAARCGLPSDWLILRHDADGDYADASNAHRAVLIPQEAVACIFAWARESHARVGFISEPPPGPQTLATLPPDLIVDAAEAADRCSLTIQMAPLAGGSATLLARRHAPDGQVACLRSWLTAHHIH